MPVVATVDNSTGTSAVNFLHPYTGETIIINPGEEYRVYELPFGSVVPRSRHLISSSARSRTRPRVLGSAFLLISTRGADSGSDWIRSITQPPTRRLFPPRNRTPVTPTVFEVSKVVIAPESETATGPNFPKTFELTVDVANGETITGLNITDVMPANLQYIPGSLTVCGRWRLHNEFRTSCARPRSSQLVAHSTFPSPPSPGPSVIRTPLSNIISLCRSSIPRWALR